MVDFRELIAKLNLWRLGKSVKISECRNLGSMYLKSPPISIRYPSFRLTCHVTYESADHTNCSNSFESLIALLDGALRNLSLLDALTRNGWQERRMCGPLPLIDVYSMQEPLNFVAITQIHARTGKSPPDARIKSFVIAL